MRKNENEVVDLPEKKIIAVRWKGLTARTIQASVTFPGGGKKEKGKSSTNLNARRKDLTKHHHQRVPSKKEKKRDEAL